MFLLAFYCRGMELADLLNITGENVKGYFFEFQHRSNGQTQRVPLPKPAADIIADCISRALSVSDTPVDSEAF